MVIEEWRLGRGARARIFDQQAPIIFHDSRYAERLPIGEGRLRLLLAATRPTPARLEVLTRGERLSAASRYKRGCAGRGAFRARSALARRPRRDAPPPQWPVRGYVLMDYQAFASFFAAVNPGVKPSEKFAYVQDMVIMAMG